MMGRGVEEMAACGGGEGGGERGGTTVWLSRTDGGIASKHENGGKMHAR
jgi:hypothetical protein